MSRELIVNAEWLEKILDDSLESPETNSFCPEIPKIAGCCLSCVDCLIAHSDGKVREYIAKGEKNDNC